MKTIIAIVQFVFGLLPTIIDAIQKTEQLVPGSGQGAQKLALVHDTLQGAFSTMQDLELTWEQVWPAIKAVVDRFVAIKNALGEFKTGQAATA